MGLTDFDYGANIPQECFGMLVCPHCGKAVMCSDVEVALKTYGKLIEQGDMSTMVDVSGMKGTSTSGGYLPWLEGNCIKDKDSVVIDAVREPRRRTGPVLHVDVTVVSSKTKYTWKVWKGFTLDMLIESLGGETDTWKGKSVKVVRGGNAGQYVNLQ
jgi:hypothetical protein